MHEFKYAYPAYFYLIALAALLYFFYNLRKLWAASAGKPDPAAKPGPWQFFINALTFGIFQKRVFSRRFSYPALMHLLLAWGFFILFFATTVDFFVARGWFAAFLPRLDTPWFASLNDAAGLMLIAGLLLALFRRIFTRPEKLPNDFFTGRGNFLGDSGIILFLLILALGGFFAEAARLAVYQPPTAEYSWIGYPLSTLFSVAAWQRLELVLWWFHALSALLFIALLPLTKMFHVLAALVNVAFTNRRLRGRLRPMFVSRLMEDPEADLENISLGVSHSREFRWKQLLDAIACTECARCTTVCPANATDKPLSPMKIMTDIRQHLYAGELGTGEQKDLVGATITETELWSCTTCGACMAECPVLNEHVPAIVDMRRYLVLSEGKPPEQASESLEKTLSTGNPWGFPKKDRLKWATDAGFDVPVFSEKKKADVLYWVGCAGAYDPLNQQVAVSMVRIFEAAGVDYAVLGTEESCTGDSARRLGEEYLFETLALQNIETLNRYDFKTIVTPCPHCFNTLKNEYPAFEGNYEVVHHSEFISQLIAAGKLSPDKSLEGKVTYHDACYLGRHNQIYAAPREVLGNLLTTGGEVTELSRHHANSFCCGAGGGNMWHDIEAGSRMNVNRIEEVIQSGADTLATACSFCLIMLDDAVKIKGQEESLKVRDIAQVVAEGLPVSKG
ncbi:MAG: (Fe-S)-binding protein [FCB group bacterium]|nr:(Fe-S)-binding protein [FCB group bacterium]